MLNIETDKKSVRIGSFSTTVLIKMRTKTDFNNYLFWNLRADCKHIPVKISKMLMNAYNKASEVPFKPTNRTMFLKICFLCFVLQLQEEPSQLGGDGTFKGKRYFTSPTGRGFFMKLSRCRRDERFTSIASPSGKLYSFIYYFVHSFFRLFIHSFINSFMCLYMFAP